MAVENVKVTCDGASGTAGAFIVRVEANGKSVHQSTVTGAPVPERGGDVWEWSLSWQLEGEVDVVLTDWTHIDWTTNEGTVQNVHGTYHLSCPTPTTEAPTTTENVATVPSLVVDPSVPTTVVKLSTVAPSTSVLSDQFYWAEQTTTTQWGPCFEDGSCLTTATVLEQTENTLPATGAATSPMVGAGVVLLALGAVALRVARPRRLA